MPGETLYPVIQVLCLEIPIEKQHSASKKPITNQGFNDESTTGEYVI